MLKVILNIDLDIDHMNLIFHIDWDIMKTLNTKGEVSISNCSKARTAADTKTHRHGQKHWECFCKMF